MEILRHKDIIDELVKSGHKIMSTCSEEEKQPMKVRSHARDRCETCEQTAFTRRKALFLYPQLLFKQPNH